MTAPPGRKAERAGARILLISPDAAVVSRSREAFTAPEHALRVAPAIDRALEDPVRPDLILLDRVDGSGKAFRAIRDRHAGVPIVALVDHGDLDQAIRALEAGAFGHASRRCEPGALHAIGARAIVAAAAGGRPGSTWRARLGELLGGGAAMQSVLDRVERGGASARHVMILGENGTGRAIVAQKIHLIGGRREGPFISVSCLGTGAADLGARLFGREPGADPGATFSTGLIEIAQRGSIFIEYLESMPARTREDLLDTIAGPEGGRPGVAPPPDVRFLSSVTIGPGAPVLEGFPADLRHRLGDECIVLPPLRDRCEDIAELAVRLLREACNRMGAPARRLTDEAIACLAAHTWRGNLPELESVIERAVLLSTADRLGPGEIRPCLNVQPGASGASGVEDPIRRALREAGGRIDGAALILGVSRSWLQRRLGGMGPGS